MKIKTPFYKKKWFWIAIIVIAFIGAFVEEKEPEQETSAKVNQVDTQKKEAEDAKKKAADDPAKKKADQEAAAKKKAEDASAKKEKIKAEYIKESKPNIDKATKAYDDIWSAYWKPTFDKMAAGNYDRYASYNAMTEAGKLYENLQMFSLHMPEGLPKDDKKSLEDFKRNLGTAAMVRKEATKLAADMINKNDFAPATMNKIQEKVSQADSLMITALANLVAFETKYGITR